MVRAEASTPVDALTALIAAAVVKALSFAPSAAVVAVPNEPEITRPFASAAAPLLVLPPTAVVMVPPAMVWLPSALARVLDSDMLMFWLASAPMWSD